MQRTKVLTRPSRKQPQKNGNSYSLSGLNTADRTSAKNYQIENCFTECKHCNFEGGRERSGKWTFSTVFCSFSFKHLRLREMQPLETKSHPIDLFPDKPPIGSSEAASAMTPLRDGKPWRYSSNRQGCWQPPDRTIGLATRSTWITYWHWAKQKNSKSSCIWITASLSAASFPTKQNLSAYAGATCILVSWPVVEDQLFLVSVLHNEVSPI